MLHDQDNHDMNKLETFKIHLVTDITGNESDEIGASRCKKLLEGVHVGPFQKFRAPQKHATKHGLVPEMLSPSTPPTFL